MGSPDRSPGGGVLLRSSLSKDRIFRMIQLGVARRAGRAIIQDDAPSSPDGKLKLSGVSVHNRKKS